MNELNQHNKLLKDNMNNYKLEMHNLEGTNEVLMSEVIFLWITYFRLKS